jgi:hypothetical protein
VIVKVVIKFLIFKNLISQVHKVKSYVKAYIYIYIYIQIHFKVTLDGVIKIYSNSTKLDRCSWAGYVLICRENKNIMLKLIKLSLGTTNHASYSEDIWGSGGMAAPTLDGV